jgi:ketosteroid isomerase-like protein
MSSASYSDPIQDAALQFLQAYWAADLRRALAACAPAATISFPPTAPFENPAPIETILPRIFAQVYTRFVGGRFDVTVDRRWTGGSTTFVEYTARGDLVTGDRYVCQYLAILEIHHGKVAKWKTYTDTKYVFDKLL